jgi:hypothetical protein
MARRKSGKPEVRMKSHGIYSGWDKKSRDLPKIIELTTRVPATIDIEFGFVVNIGGAKNRHLDYCIDHPGIRDENGAVRKPFDGTVFIKSNDWDFYLGDTVWAPIDDKIGDWRLTLEIDGDLIADKTFELFRV